jgi:hypothetical protein
MKEDMPTRRPIGKRLFLPGLILLLLLIFFAWTASKRAQPVQAVRQTEPGLDARTAVGQRPSSQSSPSAAQTSRRAAGPLSAQRVLKYGRGEGEVGMVHLREMEPVGPESFAVARDGRILVADVANQRVVIYARDGTYLRSIAVPGIALGDVVADPQGRVYVYDQVGRALHQYDADGTARGTLNLNPKDIDTRGYFHAAGDAIYFADAAVRDVLVATVQDGQLVAPDASVERTTDGIHGESGRVYAVSLDRGKALELQVREPAQGAAQTFEVALPGVVSARYAGEDEAQRFYVQTERLSGASIVLEVLAFNAAGQLLNATRMPENDYAIWTAKLVDVRSDGTIVQFLPERDQAKLNLFTN